MQDNSLNHSGFSFLHGGGEMGELTRNYNWDQTDVGRFENWPQSLKASVGLMLHSGFPMLLFWDKNKLITFYNDAFRPSLGAEGKHPSLGKPAQEMWSEIWDYIGPLLHKVIETGEPVYFENQLVPFYRNGKVEDIYWTFSYSPAYDDAGEINGVMVICSETTKAVVSRRQLEESESRFRTMAENSDVLIAIADENSYATYFNKAWVDLTGRPMEELLNYGWVDLVHPEDRDNYFNKYMDSFKNRVPFTSEFRILNSGGNYCKLIARVVPRISPEGIFSGYISSCIDITKQSEDRRLLQESEAQLELLSDTVPAMIFYLDHEQRYRTYNKRFNDWFGVEGNDAIGQTVREFIGEEAYKKVSPFLEKVYNGEVVQFELLSPTKMNQERRLNIVYTPHKSSQGKVLGLIVHASDISEQGKLRDALETEVQKRTKELADAIASLNTLNSELKRSNINLEEFAHAASHDLKEPVRKIHFFTNQLKEQLSNRLTESETRSFSRIENATHRMGNLIDDLLLYSHVSQRPHEMESIDLNAKVQRVLEDLEIDIQEKNAKLIVSQLPVIQGYRRQIQQLFQNLISNALKYSKSDATPEITIKADVKKIDEKLYHVIEVADNGIGFEQQYAQKIFQMFARLHGKNEYSGTGVGLSIVQKVVENHNGMITAEGEPGIGSKFTVYLPMTTG